LGAGGYAVVVEAQIGKRKLAVKKLKNIMKDIDYTVQALREIKVQRLLNHKNILPLEHVFAPASNKFRDVYLGLELMDCSLTQAI